MTTSTTTPFDEDTIGREEFIAEDRSAARIHDEMMSTLTKKWHRSRHFRLERRVTTLQI